jgi:hypothetical protein
MLRVAFYLQFTLVFSLMMDYLIQNIQLFSTNIQLFWTDDMMMMMIF